MNKFFKLILFVLLFINSVNTFAYFVKDTSKYYINPKHNVANEIIVNNNLNYYELPKSESLIERVIDEIKSFLQDLILETTSNRSYQVILLIIVIIIIIILYKKYAGDGINLLFRRKKAIVIPEFQMGDDIREVDFDKLIENSLNVSDFNSALRFQYLKLLKQLAAKEMIAWRAEKTNYDYYYELSNSELRLDFLNLSNAFNYTEYGNYLISSEDYKKLSLRFNSLFSKIGGLNA